MLSLYITPSEYWVDTIIEYIGMPSSHVMRAFDQSVFNAGALIIIEWREETCRSMIEQRSAVTCCCTSHFTHAQPKCLTFIDAFAYAGE